MLSICTIKSSAQAFKYYEADNYYANEASEACHWWGIGAERLGLSGSIEPNRFKQLLEGRLPDGQQIGLTKDGSINHRPGYDLTFSAPKSVSLLAEIGGDERLYNCHDAAVNHALSYLEQHAAQTRYRVGGEVHFEQTANLVVAKFQHNLSRSQDPQLHTHCVVLNATQRANDQWRSLSSEALFNNKMLAGILYRSQLAYELKQLGYGITKTHTDGRFEIKGVPEPLLEHFSKRRQQVVEAMAERGLTGAKAAETATLMTREGKQVVDKEALQKDWQEEIKNHAFNMAEFIGQTKALKPSSLLHHSEAAQQALHYAMAQLSEREACFSQSELIRAALAKGLGDVLLPDIEAAIQVEQAQGELIPAPVEGLANHNAYWTTRAAVQLEQATLNLMQDGWMAKAPIGKEQDVQAFLNQQVTNKTALNQDQQGAATLILTSPDRVIGIQGYAGTGKTTMLATVKSFAEQQGYTLIGLAPSAAAANQLSAGAGITSTTLSQHLTQSEKAMSKPIAQAESNKSVKPIGFDSKAIWILDESSMASTQQVHDLLAAAQQVDVRVILVGDAKQLGAVDAGKPFVQLQKAGMSTAVMDTIIRQREPQLLDAVYAAIKGDIAAALDKLDGNVIEIRDKTERLAQLANDYLALTPQQRDKALILTSAKEDQAALNGLVRAGLKQEGLLKGSEFQQTTLSNRGLTTAERTLVTNYSQGDSVRFNRSYSSLGIKAGEYLQVVKMDTEHNQLTLRNQKNSEITWQPHLIAGKRKGAIEIYRPETRTLMVGDSLRWTRNEAKQHLVNAETAQVLQVDKQRAELQLHNGQLLSLDLRSPITQHWDHAYASTVHATQGKTTDIVFAHAESHRTNLTNQQSFYVTISRARDSAYLYVDNKEQYLSTLNKYLGEKTSALESAYADSSTLKTSVNRLNDDLQLAALSNNRNLSKEMEIEI